MASDRDYWGQRPALRQVIEKRDLFCALYSDRASHFFVTPKAGEASGGFRPGKGGCRRSCGVPDFNRRFTVEAAEPGQAFVKATGRDLERIFSISVPISWAATARTGSL